MGTVVASDILDRASIILQDSTNVRFPESELLDFLNDAQREIVLHRPDANMQNANMTLVAGSKQSIPAGGLRLIDVVRNAGGKAITQVNREVLDETLPNWHETAAGADKVQHYIYDPADPKNFYVYPKGTSSMDVEVVYSSSPSEVASTTGTITLDDIYANCILDYILYRSYQKDSEYAGNAQRSMMHYQGFTNALGIKTQADGATTPVPVVGV